MFCFICGKVSFIKMSNDSKKKKWTVQSFKFVSETSKLQQNRVSSCVRKATELLNVNSPCVSEV